MYDRSTVCGIQVLSISKLLDYIVQLLITFDDDNIGTYFKNKNELLNSDEKQKFDQPKNLKLRSSSQHVLNNENSFNDYFVDAEINPHPNNSRILTKYPNRQTNNQIVNSNFITNL